MVTGKWVNSDADDELEIPVDDGFFFEREETGVPGKGTEKNWRNFK